MSKQEHSRKTLPGASPAQFARRYGAYGYRITSDGSIYGFDQFYESFVVKHPGQPVQRCKTIWPEDLVEETVLKSDYYHTPGRRAVA